MKIGNDGDESRRFRTDPSLQRLRNQYRGMHSGSINPFFQRGTKDPRIRLVRFEALFGRR